MRQFILHLFFWIIYLLLETYVEFAWISSSFSDISDVQRFILALKEESTLLIARVPLVYISIYIIHNVSIDQKQYVKAAIWVLVAFIFFTLLHRVLQVFVILPYLYRESDIGPVFFPMRLIIAFLDLILVAGIANAISLYQSQQLMFEKQQNLRKEKLEAELHLLKAQTNPHFLFNTLNNIYALARKNSPQTAEVVMKLSKLLRFMLYESGKKSISIVDEVRLLEDYIELEKIRYNERLGISFEKKMDTDSYNITPLILLPFVENAFKHGTSESRFDTFINISLKVQKGKLDFKVINSIDDDPILEEKENMGLKNVQRQLELVYSDYSLNIQRNTNTFEIILQIDLNSHVML